MDFKEYYMSGGGTKPKLPPAPPPAPTPVEVDGGVADRTIRTAKRQRGRRSTILTEGGLGVPDVAVNPNMEPKKSLLG